MRKTLLLICNFSVILLISCLSPSEKANNLFVDACRLVKSAQKTEEESYSEAYELYITALTKAEKITSKYPLSQIAKQLQKGQTKIVIFTLSELKEKIVPYAKMKAEAEKNQLTCAFLIAQTIEYGSFKNEALFKIAVKHARLGQYDQALYVINRIKGVLGAFYITEFLDNLAEEYTKNRKIGEFFKKLPQIIQLTETIDDNFFLTRALVAIADKFFEVGDKNNGPKFLAQALEAAKTPRNARALIKVANEYSKVGRKDKSLEILSEAVQIVKIIQPCYEKAMYLIQIANEYLKIGQDIKSYDLFSLIIQTAKRLDLTSTKRNYEVGWMVREFIKTKQYDKALQVAEVIKLGIVRNIFIGEIAVNCAEGHEFDKAFKIVTNIDDPSIIAWTLVGIESEYEKIGQKDKSDKIFNRVIELIKKAKATKFYNTWSLTEMVIKYIDVKNYDKALKIAETIKGTSDKIGALTKIAVEYAKSGDRNRAFDILVKAKQVIKATKNNHNGLEDMIEIARSYAEIGEYDQAFQIVESVEDVHNFYKDWALNYIAIKCAEDKLFDKALEITRAIEIKIEEDANAKINALNRIAVIYNESREKYKSIELLSEALEIAKSIKKSHYSRNDALMKIALNFANFGELIKALEISKLIDNPFNKTLVLVEIAVKNNEKRQKLDVNAKKILHGIIKGIESNKISL